MHVRMSHILVYVMIKKGKGECSPLWVRELRKSYKAMLWVRELRKSYKAMEKCKNDGNDFYTVVNILALVVSLLAQGLEFGVIWALYPKS
jgi:hypothetical protein